MSNKIPKITSDAEAAKQEPASPELAKESKWEKVKSFLSNEEVQKQAVKTAAGTVASIAGIKSLYDVRAYIKQRFIVRGVLGCKLVVGKGL